MNIITYLTLYKIDKTIQNLQISQALSRDPA